MGKFFSYQVALVDDHEIFREGFEKLLNSIPGISITGSYPGPPVMINDLAANTPQIIFMDVQMPDIDGVEATKQVLALYPEIKIIALTQCCDGETASKMFEAGAAGYMTKGQTAKDLPDVFRSIENGEKYVTPAMALEYTKYNIHAEPPTEEEERIKREQSKYTHRELSIMAHLSYGKTDKEIGAALDISPKTVDKDKRNIMKIMGVNKVTQIVANAIRNGLIP